MSNLDRVLDEAMTLSLEQPFPHPEKVEQTVTQMREVCRQFDKLNLSLDELIAQIELDIRNSPLTAYRLGQKTPYENGEWDYL